MLDYAKVLVKNDLNFMNLQGNYFSSKLKLIGYFEGFISTTGELYSAYGLKY